MDERKTIGLGGGCHWCTEAVFQALRGVLKVEQGWIASTAENTEFSEAVLVHYQPTNISLDSLLYVHLHTHSSRSAHQLRERYRSAVYTLNAEDTRHCKSLLEALQQHFTQPLVCRVLPFAEFKSSREPIRNYYNKRPDKPFCVKHIEPKRQLLLEKCPWLVNHRVLPILSDKEIQVRVESIADGYTRSKYRGSTYGLSKKSFNQGRSIKVYAEELGGSDFISFNLYIKKDSILIRPCEMPLSKVLAFLRLYY